MRSGVVLPTGEASTTRQGLSQFEGISAESVGSRALCAHLLAIPPGGRILEIGPGTGKASVALAARGLTLVGVEVGEQLAAVARRMATDELGNTA